MCADTYKRMSIVYNIVFFPVGHLDFLLWGSFFLFRVQHTFGGNIWGFLIFLGNNIGTRE